VPSPPDNPSRLEAIFHAVSEAAPADRDAILHRECDGDATLRRAALELLNACEQAGASPFWSRSAVESEAMLSAASHDNQALDRYRLLDRIGAGGMGVVYRAERSDAAFSKIVAIKILGWSAGDELAIRRFRQEREILARLEHPHIARLLDGGEAGDGSPFLVMEFVDGMPIDRFASEHSLTERERLHLFLDVCSAVSYAHRNLIVHRDIKPGNIFVTAEGQVKLLDFGIAKLQSDSQEATISAAALTPEYASPEQVRSLPVSTLTDVYSLGATLYRLLTGRPVYGPSLTPPELARAVCEQDPDFTGLELDGDLKVILCAAMHKQPDRRYASVDLLAGDIRRYLHAFPVLARADSLAYRFTRFVARHRFAAAIGVLTVLVSASLAAGLLFQWREAQRRSEDVRTLAGSLVFDLYENIRDLPGSLQARQQVARNAWLYLDRLAQDRKPSNELKHNLATAYRKLGDILGEPFSSSLGDSEGAMRNYRESQRLFEQSRQPPANELATTYERLSRMLWRRGDVTESLHLANRALALRQRLLHEHPHDAGAIVDLEQAYLFVGEAVYTGASRSSDTAGILKTLDHYQNAIAAARQLMQRADKLPPALRSRAWDAWGIAHRHTSYCYWSLGEITQDPSKFQQALGLSRIGYESAEKAAAAETGRFSLRWTLTGAYGEYGHALMLTGDLPGGIAWHDRSLNGLIALEKLDPQNHELQREIAETALRLGRNRAALDPKRAMLDYQRALSMYDAFMNSNPADMENVRLAVEARNGMAELLLQQHDAPAAARICHSSIELLRRTNYPCDLKTAVLAVLTRTRKKG